MNYFALFFALLLFVSCNTEKKDLNIENKNSQQSSKVETKKQEKLTNAKIVFYEFGSTTCIPCRQMRPVMESIEKKYGDQINVIFVDVNKEIEKAKSYGIRIIPTQVFVDNSGNELHRHEGFYPEKEIDKFLQSKGLNIIE
jgi:thioredoxin 1